MTDSGYPMRVISPSIGSLGAAASPVTMLREGQQLTATSAAGNNSAGGLAIGATLGSVGPGPCQAWFIESIGLSSLLDVVVWIQFANSNVIANGAASSLIAVMVGPNYGGAVVPINQFIREGESVTFILRTTVATGSGTDTFGFRAGFNGHRVTNDFSFENDKVWLAIGDSITNTTGPTYGSEFYHSLVQDYLLTNRKGYRRILKGDGGWKTSHAVIALKRGYFNVPSPKLITLLLGTNETLTSDYTTNLPLFTAWKQARYPDAIMCVLGPPPRQDSIETTVLAGIRTGAASHVASLNDPNIRYLSLGTAFSAVGDTNYITTDGTSSGARVHPNSAGHAGMASVITADLATILPAL